MSVTARSSGVAPNSDRPPLATSSRYRQIAVISVITWPLSRRSAGSGEQLSALLKAFFYWPKFLSGTRSIETAKADQVIDDCLEMFLAHYQAE
ncbi:TetR/AcrR family transcriptional regulator C-terminal domain-containing protein (plasmid) [Agrobacterium sp. rho-8.1]